ncbi:MAG: hypothetical protein M1818_007975 [Claussenomyces sp. TS43310]|nr:MAG: hypothetical protein M1818_007975 [Claussenomyces sp. TS43310]
MTDIRREHEYVTLKVFVSGDPQAKNEKRVFEHLKTTKSSHAGARFIRVLRDSFELPGEKGPHECLVHDALGVTLKQLRELSDGEKLPFELVRPIIYHVLFALNYLHSQAKVVHTDIQEENNMMSIADKELLKQFEEEEWPDPSLRSIDGNRIIYASRDLEVPDDFSHFVVCDLGYAVFGEKKYSGEAMPDLYRAPELVLRTTWDEKIDIWSLGLMCWTLLEGDHLFKDRLPSRSDSTPAHIARMVALLGPPPKDMLNRGSWSYNFFDESGNLKADVENATTSLEDEFGGLIGEEKTSCLKFLRRTLQWRPEDRATAGELLDDLHEVYW